MQYKTLRLQKNVGASEENDTAVHFFTSHNAGSGLHIRDVTGLDAPDFNVNLAPTANNQTSIYNGTRSQNRQIVITASIRPDYATGRSVSDIRESISKLALPDEDLGESVRLDFIEGDDTIHKYTWGYISKIESPPYAKDPLIQITIECVPIHFVAPYSLTYTINSKKVELNPRGSAPTGLKLTLKIVSGKTNVIHIRKNDTIVFRITTEDMLLAGDEIVIDTNPDKLETNYTRGGGVYNILKYVTSDSKWFSLSSEKQTLTALAIAGCEIVIDAVTFKPKYWGV